MRTLWFVLLMFVPLLVGLPRMARCQGTAEAPGPRVAVKTLEGVAAVVGDKPILRSQVEERFEVFSPQFEIDVSDTSRANQLRREILDNLVNEQLLLLEAESQGLKIDEQQIGDAVEAAIKGDQERLGAAEFAAELAKEGITEADLRTQYAADLRDDFLRRQLVQRDVLSKVVVTDLQVENHFKENRASIGKRPRALRVLDLFVRVSADSAIEVSYRKRIDEIRREIAAGMAFEQAAKLYSDDDRSRDAGGLLGRFAPGDLGDRAFERIAFTAPPGEVSEAIRTNLGYHLIQVVDRDPQGAWAQIRHVLLQVTPSRSDEVSTRRRTESVRERIVAGGLDFAEAVRRYSDDPVSRESGGDVGWLPIDNFLGETRAAVDSLRVGDVSRVARVEGGFHIFKLVGEQAETDYSFEEIRDELRVMVENQERQKKLDEYLAGLRKKVFVEIRSL